MTIIQKLKSLFNDHINNVELLRNIIYLINISIITTGFFYLINNSDQKNECSFHEANRFMSVFIIICYTLQTIISLPLYFYLQDEFIHGFFANTVIFSVFKVPAFFIFGSGYITYCVLIRHYLLLLVILSNFWESIILCISLYNIFYYFFHSCCMQKEKQNVEDPLPPYSE